MSTKKVPQKKRVIVYVDGFNLYFGLKSKGWKRYYWLNIQELAKNILSSDQKLITVKYFTSRISSPPDKNQRQNTYIEALETLKDFHIYYGKYQSNTKTCKKCGNIEAVPNEKMTDVNIAVEMLTDAFEDKFDTAILISADSDLTAPIKSILRLFKMKRVTLAFPPERYSVSLKTMASSSFIIGRRKFAASLFDDQVKKKNGFILRRPERWQ